MKITTLLYSLIYLCASFCGCGDDDEEVNSVYLNSPNLVSIQDNTNQFQVNDTLFFMIKVPNIITDEMIGEINISEVSGEQTICYSSFRVLEINGFQNPQVVSLSENEIIYNGNEVLLNGNSFSVSTTLVNEFYESHVGIILKESGNFALSGSRYIENRPLILTCDGENGVSVILESTFVNGDENNRFNFLVD